MSDKRLRLGLFPTPVEKLKNIKKKRLKDKTLYIKRDDLSGVGLGGNKVRKLEYLLKDAVDHGCDVVLTTGGLQSNHAAMTAACCRKLGLACELCLSGYSEQNKGNLLLDRLFQAKIHFIETDSEQFMKERAMVLKKEGRKPYVIPMGGTNALGLLGYVHAVKEIKEQIGSVDHIVLTFGTGGTYAGTLLGTMKYMKGTKVTGINVIDSDDHVHNIVKIMNQTAPHIGIDKHFCDDDITVFQYCGKGYAIPSKKGNKAIAKLAKTEGILLDPVYTGKAFGGFLDLLKKGYFEEDKSILFIHTGGQAALFAIEMEE